MSENTPTINADDRHVKSIITNIRSCVKSGSAYSAYVKAHGVTRENVKIHAAALAALAYPNEEQIQRKDGVRTTYGNAVQAAGNGLRRALPKADVEPSQADYLAAVLKAVDAAVDHEIDAAVVMETVAAHVDGLLS